MKQTIASVLDDSDRAALLHPFTDFAAHKRSGGRAFVAAEHIYLTDAEAKQYMDGMSGLWCVNLGYSQPKIVRAVTEQLERLPYYNSFFNCTTDITIEMAQRLIAVLPEGFNHVFFTNSGSEANDTNIRLVHRYFDLIDQPRRKLIISRKNAYHGSTIAAASLGGMSSMHKQFTGLPYVHHIEQPYAFENAGELDEAAYGRAAARLLSEKIDELGEANVAAFIAEPVQGAGGVIIPPQNYWTEVARICSERGVLLISDEVICGFGRTGEWFGCQTYGVQPDLISFAKAVTNGFQPLGGVAVADKVADRCSPPRAANSPTASPIPDIRWPARRASPPWTSTGKPPSWKRCCRTQPTTGATAGVRSSTTPSSARPAPKACSAPWNWCATRPAGSASTPTTAPPSIAATPPSATA